MNKTTTNSPPELGLVPWERDYETALTLAETANKPVLILFQEVPGCSTCTNFGRDVLSDPSFVAFVSKSFIPLAIYNNHPGKDAEVLAQYGEPAWNNPVMRVVDQVGMDVIDRIANCYKLDEIISRLKMALD